MNKNITEVIRELLTQAVNEQSSKEWNNNHDYPLMEGCGGYGGGGCGGSRYSWNIGPKYEEESPKPSKAKKIDPVKPKKPAKKAMPNPMNDAQAKKLAEKLMKAHTEITDDPDYDRMNREAAYNNFVNYLERNYLLDVAKEKLRNKKKSLKEETEMVNENSILGAILNESTDAKSLEDKSMKKFLKLARSTDDLIRSNLYIGKDRYSLFANSDMGGDSIVFKRSSLGDEISFHATPFWEGEYGIDVQVIRDGDMLFFSNYKAEAKPLEAALKKDVSPEEYLDVYLAAMQKILPKVLKAIGSKLNEETLTESVTADTAEEKSGIKQDKEAYLLLKKLRTLLGNLQRAEDKSRRSKYDTRPVSPAQLEKIDSMYDDAEELKMLLSDRGWKVSWIDGHNDVYSITKIGGKKALKEAAEEKDFDTALEGFIDIVIKRYKAYHKFMDFTKVPFPTFSVMEGQKKVRVVIATPQKSVFCFVDKETGDIYKAAGWTAAAKGARGNIYSKENGAEALPEEPDMPHIRYNKGIKY